MSSCEAELTAIQQGVAEAMYVKHVLEELGWNPKVQVYSDSMSAIQFCHKRGVGRIKHLDLRRFWLQDLLRDHRLLMQHVPTAENTADLLTKAFSSIAAERLGLSQGE